MMARLRGLRHGALLAMLAIYSLFPIYFITVQSLKTPQEDVFGSPLYVRDPTFENYTELFEGGEASVRGYVIVPHVPFLIWLVNSAIVLAGATLLTLVAGVLAAYALARLALVAANPVRHLRHPPDDPVRSCLPGGHPAGAR
jgi:ABC-type glycerol-3-phosphate transport system permease component